MGWTVILEDENGKKVSTINAEWSFDNSSTELSILIKYLDPYGDTKFNGLQMDDLIDDLKKLQELNYSETTGEVIKLASQCSVTSHTCLVFYGD